MSVNKTMTDAEKAWVARYERETDFDLLRIEDFENGEISFHEMAWYNIDWYENHVCDVHLRIQKDVPGEEEAMMARLGIPHD